MSEEATLDEFATKKESEERKNTLRLGPNQVEIPDSWEVSTFEEVNNPDKPIGYGVVKPGEDIDDGIPLVKIEDVVDGYLSADQEFHQINEEKDKKYSRSRLSGGEILVSIQGTVGDAVIVPPEMEGANISRTIARVSPNQPNNLWIKYYIESRPLQDYIQIVSSGSTRASYNIGDIRKTSVALPPLPEQRKIATVLYIVDKMIAGTLEEISSINKIKKGIQKDIFNRGIDENGQIRPEPSKAENLYSDSQFGLIPAQWEIKKISDIVPENRPVTYGIVQPGAYVEGGIPIIRGQNYINGWEPISEFFRVDPELHEEYSRCITKPNDVLLCIAGANTGAVNIVPEWIEEANLTQTTARIAVNEKIAEPEFIRFALSSPFLQKQVDAWTRGSAQPGLNLGRVEKFRVPIPKRGEQREIVSKLKTIENRARKEQEIKEKLLTIKKGLMQDLLSGTVRTTDTNIEVPDEIAQHG